MKERNAWEEVRRLIASGDVVGASSIAEHESYASVQRLLAWDFYGRRDIVNAIQWFSKAAAQGDPESLFGMASAYFALRQYSDALTYFEKAADNGVSRAYYWIGSIHCAGLGTSKDLGKALFYFKKSATHGYLIGQRRVLYVTGRQGSNWKRILLAPLIGIVYLRTFVIALRNRNDVRLADIKNYFEMGKDVDKR